MERRKKTEAMTMEGIIAHACHFSTNAFAQKRERFQALVAEQHPEVLMITCSDSRILPELLTQADAGDLFVLRSAGNIVPAHGAGCGGEQATIEYAVAALGVRHVIICGHSHCGAMQGLLHPELVHGMPRVATWLAHAEAAHSILAERHGNLSEEERLHQAAKENVVVQMANLNYIDHACLELLETWEEEHKATGGRLIIEWEALSGRSRKGRSVQIEVPPAAAERPASTA